MSARHWMRRCAVPLLALLASGVWPASALAHELGAMKVTALFGADGTYTIDIVVDADHLPPWLSPFSTPGGVLGGDETSADELRARIEAFRETFLERTRIEFDGTRARPHEAPPDAPGPALSGPSGQPGPSSAPRDATGAGSSVSRTITFRLAGRVPPGAATFTWSHDQPLGAYLFGVQNEGDPRPSREWLVAGRTSRPFPLRHLTAPPTRAEIVIQYLVLGYTHILPKGLDHILFVLGIFLMSLKARPVLLQVTAFTVAHSITLGLSIYGVVSLSPRIVEPLIALSIVYVAAENILTTAFTPWRVGVVFGFGLLHGMGFAGVLRELGLPRSEFIPALISFNLGVEGGQLTVIALAFLAVGLWFGARPWYRARITVPASALIALVGLYWTVQRVLA